MRVASLICDSPAALPLYVEKPGGNKFRIHTHILPMGRVQSETRISRMCFASVKHVLKIALLHNVCICARDILLRGMGTYAKKASLEKHFPPAPRR